MVSVVDIVVSVVGVVVGAAGVVGVVVSVVGVVVSVVGVVVSCGRVAGVVVSSSVARVAFSSGQCSWCSGQ